MENSVRSEVVVQVEKLYFQFPANWQVGRYDQWKFYRHVSGQGVKAVDVIAVSPEKTAFLIEVKDYRHPQAAKPSDLPKQLAQKVYDTLAKDCCTTGYTAKLLRYAVLTSSFTPQ
ncbi:MAG: hypothetical protein QM520_06725 [Gammaproteobacteria bacterium]|nr:hypothetical protein [Gammaproteobacteria bacterium]